MSIYPTFATLTTMPIGGVVISAPTIGALAGVTAGSLLGWGVYELCKKADTTYNQVEAREDGKEKRKEKFKFPENPDDFMPELPRDDKGRIQPADNIRIRPEKHSPKPGDTYNPRHHDQHYHVEIRRDPNAGWAHDNKEIIKPPDYKP